MPAALGLVAGGVLLGRRLSRRDLRTEYVIECVVLGVMLLFLLIIVTIANVTYSGFNFAIRNGFRADWVMGIGYVVMEVGSYGPLLWIACREGNGERAAASQLDNEQQADSLLEEFKERRRRLQIFRERAQMTPAEMKVLAHGAPWPPNASKLRTRLYLKDGRARINEIDDMVH